jgi:hypothetical protein
MQPLELGTRDVRGPGTAGTDQEPPPIPLVRASRAWTALKVSSVLESLAFLARGVECGRPPRAPACPEHIVGPLVGTIVGPVGGLLPRDAVEQLYQRAAVERGVTMGEWFEWRRARLTAHLLEDVTMLAHRGSCLGRSDVVRCTCSGVQGSWGSVPPDRWLRSPDGGTGPVPVLTPDPTGRTDPWQDTLVRLAATYRGRGSPLASKFAGSGPPTIKDMRTLAAHLERLSGAFAGPRRADRMAGLERVEWDPTLRLTPDWRVRDRAGGTEAARVELLERLWGAVGL